MTRWKTLAGRCVYRGDDAVRVYQNLTYRWLRFGRGGAFQTVLHRQQPARMVLNYLDAFTLAARHQPGEVCLLGLGGAGVAHALSAYPMPITAVEISAAVINVSRAFFMTDELLHLHIIQQDAAVFVQQQQTARYEHLLIDLFNTTTFPPACATTDFFKHCRQRLNIHGMMAVNIANQKEHRAIIQLIREHFSDSMVLFPIKKTHNLVVLACNGPSMTPLLNQLMLDKAIQKLTWSAEWGYLAETCV